MHMGRSSKHWAKDMSLASSLFSNLAAVALKLDDHRQALQYAENALRFDMTHVP